MRIGFRSVLIHINDEGLEGRLFCDQMTPWNMFSFDPIIQKSKVFVGGNIRRPLTMDEFFLLRVDLPMYQPTKAYTSKKQWKKLFEIHGGRRHCDGQLDFHARMTKTIRCLLYHSLSWRVRYGHQSPLFGVLPLGGIKGWSSIGVVPRRRGHKQRNRFVSGHLHRCQYSRIIRNQKKGSRSSHKSNIPRNIQHAVRAW